MKQNKLKTAFLTTLCIWLIAVLAFGIAVSLSKPSNKTLSTKEENQKAESRVENIPVIYRILSSVTASKSASADEAYSDFISSVLIDSEYTVNASEVKKLKSELDLRSNNADDNYYLALYHVERKIVTEYYAEKWNITPDTSEIEKLVSAGLTREEAEYTATEEAVINRLFFFSPSLKGGLAR